MLSTDRRGGRMIQCDNKRVGRPGYCRESKKGELRDAVSCVVTAMNAD